MVNLVGKKGYTGPVVYKNIDQVLALKELFPIFTEKRKHVLSEKWDMSQSYTPK